MQLMVEHTALDGLLVIKPKVWQDARGLFFEVWKSPEYAEVIGDKSFVQDNFSTSFKHTLRGLHYQKSHPQGKLVTCLAGEIFDVAVDIRVGSATFGQWFGLTLSSQNALQMWIPEGFAHGFLTLSEVAHVFYKCTDTYHPQDEAAIFWADETLNIAWPLSSSPIVSAKDQKAPCFATIFQNVKRR